MGAAALPIISGVGVLGGLIQGNKAQKTANQALKLQQGQAQNQAGLFAQTAPTYNDVIQALRGLSGLGSSNPNFNLPQVQLPYTNVTPQQLGIYQNPADALRLRAAEDEAQRNTLGALRGFSFGAGQRGLYGSSIDAAGRAAILADANRSLSGFGRQLAINAPQEALGRLQALGGMLNPGLSAGPTAAGIFGQGAQTQLGQAGLYGGMAAGTLQNYLQFQNLQNGLNQFRKPVGVSGTTVPIKPYPGDTSSNLLAGLDLGSALQGVP